jgi:hypothetical protein
VTIAIETVTFRASQELRGTDSQRPITFSVLADRPVIKTADGPESVDWVLPDADGLSDTFLKIEKSN